MKDQHIGPDRCHLLRSLRAKHVGASERIQLIGARDHRYPEVNAHADLFEALPKHPIEQGYSRDLLHPVKSRVFELSKRNWHQPEWFSPVDSRKYHRNLRHMQHLTAHFHHNAIGISVGQDAG